MHFCYDKGVRLVQVSCCYFASSSSNYLEVSRSSFHVEARRPIILLPVCL